MLIIKQTTFLATHVDHKCRNIAEKSIKIHSPRQQIMNFHFVRFFFTLVSYMFERETLQILIRSYGRVGTIRHL